MLARNSHRGTVTASFRLGLPLALLAFLLASACGGPAKGPESATPPGEWRSFEGTGSATGHRQTLRMGPDRKVSIVDLSGSLLLVGERRLGRGFRIELIGSADRPAPTDSAGTGRPSFPCPGYSMRRNPPGPRTS